MKKYIGTKLIEAEKAVRYYMPGGTKITVSDSEEISEETHQALAECVAAESGYRVRYPDGYESWSPKDVFEEAYLPLDVNKRLRTEAPSISQRMVDDFIAETEVTTVGEKTTVVRAVLRNGFEIVRASGCVSAENYDEKLGAEVCLKKIRSEVWYLLGFLLQTAVHGVK